MQNHEVAIYAYNQLKEILVADGCDDEQCLLDTLEGETDIADILVRLQRQRDEADDSAAVLKSRVEVLQQRKARFEDRSERLKMLICDIMQRTDLKKLESPEFTISLREGKESVSIAVEEFISDEYARIETIRKLDKKAIAQDLKLGKIIPGASIVRGDPTVAVRRT